MCKERHAFLWLVWTGSVGAVMLVLDHTWYTGEVWFDPSGWWTHKTHICGCQKTIVQSIRNHCIVEKGIYVWCALPQTETGMWCAVSQTEIDVCCAVSLTETSVWCAVRRIEIGVWCAVSRTETGVWCAVPQTEISAHCDHNLQFSMNL